MLRIDTPIGVIAARESDGQGPAALLIHGNSSSSRDFSRQLEGPVGKRFRPLAIDLPGHGASDDAKDPGAYSLPGHAPVVRAVVDALGLNDARFAGCSLGGHVALEMVPDLQNARGFVIFDAPPLASRASMGDAFLLHPAIGVIFSEKREREQAVAYIASLFKPGFADIPAFFLDDALRTDGRARSFLGACRARGSNRNEVATVCNLKAPLAVLHGAEDQLVNGGYFASIAMPTLWRGAVQVISGAWHTPQWETPQVFDALLEAFIAETA